MQCSSNKSDYVRKMEFILQNQSPFTLTDNDITLANEDCLICLLLRMKKEGSIVDDEYNTARLVSSRWARLHGLPKLHKLNYLLRPVMSANKTADHGLGKMLTNHLSNLRNSPFIIKELFHLIKKIHDLKNADKLIISYDATSLFTNVSLTDTTDYVLEQTYPTIFNSCLRLPRTRKLGSIYVQDWF